jgi:hypothetical protein
LKHATACSGVVLRGREAGIRDVTTVNRYDALEWKLLEAGGEGVLIRDIYSSGRRKVPRAGFAAAQNDIAFGVLCHCGEMAHSDAFSR